MQRPNRSEGAGELCAPFGRWPVSRRALGWRAPLCSDKPSPCAVPFKSASLTGADAIFPSFPFSCIFVRFVEKKETLIALLHSNLAGTVTLYCYTTVIPPCFL